MGALPPVGRGASAYTLISQRLASGVDPASGEVIQGVGQLGRLLAVHQR